MSKQRKKKQTTKKMNPETKAKLITGFKTLLSNDACRDAAREWKGALQIVPIAFAIVGTVIALTPTLVTQMQVKGSNGVYGAPTADFDVGLASFTYDLKHDQSGNVLPEDKIVHISWDDNGTIKTSNLDNLYHTESGVIRHWYCLYDKFEAQPVFEVFFIDSFKNSDGSLKYTDEQFFKALSQNINPDDGETTRNDATALACSYIAFGKEKMTYRKYSATGAQEGRYDRLGGKDLANMVPADSVPFMSAKYREMVKASWVEFIDLSYETIKIQSGWAFVGIMAAIDFGMVLLFGALLFVMTRGKNNPYRILNMWETMKMAGFGSLTPAILTLIFGFMFTQYAYLLFMFTYGLRMMWFSMKSLRPTVE